MLKKSIFLIVMVLLAGVISAADFLGGYAVEPDGSFEHGVMYSVNDEAFYITPNVGNGEKYRDENVSKLRDGRSSNSGEIFAWVDSRDNSLKVWSSGKPFFEKKLSQFGRVLYVYDSGEVFYSLLDSSWNVQRVYSFIPEAVEQRELPAKYFADHFGVNGDLLIFYDFEKSSFVQVDLKLSRIVNERLFPGVTRMRIGSDSNFLYFEYKEVINGQTLYQRGKISFDTKIFVALDDRKIDSISKQGNLIVTGIISSKKFPDLFVDGIQKSKSDKSFLSWVIVNNFSQKLVSKVFNFKNLLYIPKSLNNKVFQNENGFVEFYDFRMTSNLPGLQGSYSFGLKNENSVPFIYYQPDWESRSLLDVSNSARKLLLSCDDLLLMSNDRDMSMFFYKKMNLLPLKFAASSELAEGEKVYSAKNLTLTGLETPWVEAGKGNGVGEIISIASDSDLTALYISIGYVSAEKPYLYTANCRPKKILLSGNGFAFSVDLLDTPNPQKIKLPVNVRSLKLEILDVYSGTKWDDLCINFILGV